MILVVGGEGSGKRSFAGSLGYSEQDMADAVLDSRPVMVHLERLVFQNPDRVDALFTALEGKEVVLCNEVGSGVMPVQDGECLGREATGRLCIRLAQRASCVVRMVCGLPMVIKGTLPEKYPAE